MKMNKMKEEIKTMTEQTKKIELIESGWDAISGEDEYAAEKIIINHPELGRLFLRQGQYSNGLKSFAPKWVHGMCYRIKDSDTLMSLKDLEGNNANSGYRIFLEAYDKDRPMLCLEDETLLRWLKEAGVIDE